MNYTVNDEPTQGHEVYSLLRNELGMFACDIAWNALHSSALRNGTSHIKTLGGYAIAVTSPTAMDRAHAAMSKLLGDMDAAHVAAEAQKHAERSGV